MSDYGTIPLGLVEYLRFLRSINHQTLRALCRRRRGECTWCGERLPKYRVYYCSDECKSQVMIHCHPSHAQKGVYDRDGGTCRICGCAVKLYHNYGLRDASLPLGEVDHIVPVVEGGGFCGLDGLRLVCGPCHKKETAELRARMKVAR